MKALLVVDLQNDFLPGGALGVSEGDKIIPIINQLMDENFDLIVASKDWHPRDHGSFASLYHKKPGEIIDLDGLEQILWPDHCVQETKGSDFGPGVNSEKVDKIIYKGTSKNIDSYSAFFDNAHRKATGLEDYLKEHHVTDVYITGIATDYCVKYSAIDSAKLGFKTHVIVDACRGVNLQEGDIEKALEEMKRVGVEMITSDQVKDQGE